MQITLNGDRFTDDRIASVEDLLQRLAIEGERVAVMVNDEIIKKDRFAESRLSEGDRVEVIHMVGGG